MKFDLICFDLLRFCPDQPVLLLRLEGTAARLYAQQGDWASAASHTERPQRVDSVTA